MTTGRGSVPNRPSTPIRGIRVPDPLWQQVKAKAGPRGASRIAVALFRAYVAGEADRLIKRHMPR